MMLEARGLDVLLGDYQVLWGARLSVAAGEIVALLGPNGSGKSTLMNTISGLLRPQAGQILFQGRPIAGLPAHRIVGEGLSHVLERRRLFPFLSVRQNVLLGAYSPAARATRDDQLDWVSDLFPVIRQRADQLAHTLSGGEQQMVAIARGLMARPRLLMVDEPFLGLAPRVVDQLTEVIRAINRGGVTVLLIEQNVERALALAHRGYVLESGRTVLEGRSEDLLRSAEVRRVFLGG
ncbi:MAG: branched-chain amino acid ABC transporter ATP-binding protein [Candidatus Rokubacteria bacterium 13_1_40CM_69_27]|nr:MAG: branched-chain amino acid ABC transporter ATP-binding protein [Candidatus Rokubacteria bacterium 13_1_40CM_69_27]OLC39579.1 MAG: branched-chain amino acid ABC transporter ATP-binding protein [Candidatus Rokubacteria bacterium 13_1_40CM_4_69_5]